MAVIVPAIVLEGLEAVRDSGLTNMFDRPMVVKLAKKFGYSETASWITSNQKLYAEGIFKGFEAEPEVQQLPDSLGDDGSFAVQ